MKIVIAHGQVRISDDDTRSNLTIRNTGDVGDTVQLLEFVIARVRSTGEPVSLFVVQPNGSLSQVRQWNPVVSEVSK